MIDSEHFERNKGDTAFRREEYWGVGPYFLVHYYGDHTVFKGFKHRSSKLNTNQFVTSAPHVKDKVKILYSLHINFLKDFECRYYETSSASLSRAC